MVDALKTVIDMWDGGGARVEEFMIERPDTRINAAISVNGVSLSFISNKIERTSKKPKRKTRDWIKDEEKRGEIKRQGHVTSQLQLLTAL